MQDRLDPSGLRKYAVGWEDDGFELGISRQQCAQLPTTEIPHFPVPDFYGEDFGSSLNTKKFRDLVT
jgi:hypothetical protein